MTAAATKTPLAAALAKATAAGKPKRASGQRRAAARVTVNTLPPVPLVGTWTAYLPIRTTNPNNGQTGNSRRAAIIRTTNRAMQRATTHLVLTAMLGQRPPVLPVVVTLRRVAPSSGIDHWELGSALKAIIDETTAWLGLTNDRDARVQWVLEQRRGKPKEYAVEVEIVAMKGDFER